MGLKKSIVVIGSVLVLAACDRATAPTGPLSLHDGPAAAAKKAPVQPGGTAGTQSMSDDCVWVRNGDADSSQVCNDAIIQ